MKVRSSKVQGLITSVTVKGGRSLKKESRIWGVYHDPRGVCQPPVPYTRMRGKKEESAMARSELRSRTRGTPINAERVVALVVYHPRLKDRVPFSAADVASTTPCPPPGRRERVATRIDRGQPPSTGVNPTPRNPHPPGSTRCAERVSFDGVDPGQPPVERGLRRLGDAALDTGRSLCSNGGVDRDTAPADEIPLFWPTQEHDNEQSRNGERHRAD